MSLWLNHTATDWRGNPRTSRDPSTSRKTETTNGSWTGSSTLVIKIKKLEFLVHWKGYDDTHRTWEPKGNLSNAKEALNDFYHVNLPAPRAISIPPEDFLLLFQKRLEPFMSLHTKQIPFDRLEVDL